MKAPEVALSRGGYVPPAFKFEECPSCCERCPNCGVVPVKAYGNIKRQHDGLVGANDYRSLQKRLRYQRKQLREYQRLVAELRGHLMKAACDREAAIERIGP